MHRRDFLALFGTIAVVPPLAAQQREKTFRVGLVAIGTDPERPKYWPTFIERLQHLGYIEGQNITFDRQFAAGNRALAPELAANIARQKPDLVVVTGSQEAEVVSKAAPATPLVFILHPDPIGTGLIHSLSRPGTNATGLTQVTAELIGKRVQLATEMLPGLRRLAYLGSPSSPINELNRTAMEHAARALGLASSQIPADSPAELEAAFATIARERPDVLFVPFLATFSFARVQIVEFCARHRIPAVYDQREFVDIGGLMSYGPNIEDLFRRAAVYVDRILKGGKPADLPVERPTKFELVINLKTARALGIAISDAVIARADEVIQ